MFELLFTLLFLFVVLRVALSLGFGLLRIAVGLVCAVLVLTILPLSFALMFPVLIVGMIFMGALVFIKALLK